MPYAFPGFSTDTVELASDYDMDNDTESVSEFQRGEARTVLIQEDAESAEQTEDHPSHRGLDIQTAWDEFLTAIKTHNPGTSSWVKDQLNDFFKQSANKMQTHQRAQSGVNAHGWHSWGDLDMYSAWVDFVDEMTALRNSDW